MLSVNPAAARATSAAPIRTWGLLRKAISIVVEKESCALAAAWPSRLNNPQRTSWRACLTNSLSSPLFEADGNSPGRRISIHNVDGCAFREGPSIDRAQRNLRVNFQAGEDLHFGQVEIP